MEGTKKAELAKVRQENTSIAEYPIRVDGGLTPDAKEHLLGAVQTLSLAKNIKLMEGTVKVWEKLLIHDMVKGSFNFPEFLEGLNLAIRMPMFNRVDYADIYAEAIKLAGKRKQEEGFAKQQQRQREKAQEYSDNTGSHTFEELKKEFLKNRKVGDDVEKS